jgi:hypothetical protein
MLIITSSELQKWLSCFMCCKHNPVDGASCYQGRRRLSIYIFKLSHLKSFITILAKKTYQCVSTLLLDKIQKAIQIISNVLILVKF